MRARMICMPCCLFVCMPVSFYLHVCQSVCLQCLSACLHISLIRFSICISVFLSVWVPFSMCAYLHLGWAIDIMKHKTYRPEPVYLFIWLCHPPCIFWSGCSLHFLEKLHFLQLLIALADFVECDHVQRSFSAFRIFTVLRFSPPHREVWGYGGWPFVSVWASCGLRCSGWLGSSTLPEQVVVWTTHPTRRMFEHMKPNY